MIMIYFLRFPCLALLLSSLPRYCDAQSSTATWLFPLEDKFTINVIDTIVLEWTSNYNEAWLMMWCQLNGPGPDVSLGGQFQVQPNGSFPYVMFSINPAQRIFPVACHAQLAVEPKGTGVDGPVGITWTSRTNVAAKTFSLARRDAVTSPTPARSSPSTTSSTGTAGQTQSSSPTPSQGSTVVQIITSLASTSPSTSATAPPSSDSPNRPSSGSSSGFRLTIGLAIGLSLTVICLLGFAGWYFLFRKRSLISRQSSHLSHNGYGWGRHELEDEPRRIHEMDPSQRPGYELDGTARLGELSAEGKRKSGKSWKHKSRAKSSIYELP